MKNSFCIRVFLFFAFDGQLNSIQLLLDKGAQINTRDKNGCTALRLTDVYHQQEVTQMLRNAGARY